MTGTCTVTPRCGYSKNLQLRWGSFFLLSFLLGAQNLLVAGNPADTVYQQRNYNTKKVSGEPPVIDGKLDDAAWDAVDWSSNFLVFQPKEGKVPDQKTAFKILYDDKNLYVGIRAYDTDPSKIVKRLDRRDNIDGDFVAFMVDSYFDHLTAFEFDVNAAGVIYDAYISNDFDNEDESWDPVWFVKTNIDAEGWTAEMRIPLSQLRFSDAPDQTWGIEVLRREHRNGEMSMWRLISKSSNGFVHQFGEMHGLEGLKPQKQLEIMPYVLGKADYSEKEAGNPFATGHRYQGNAGVDAKVGITSNFTLDLTMNPDFGQVEADPSIVNLTGFQNYFREKRPFFVESNNILDYQVSQSTAWGSFNSDDLFYSRRIGRSPQVEPDLADNQYDRIPESTTILGAAKLTGKTRKGLSVGVLESVTQRERAAISDGTDTWHQVAEPLTNYFESRLIQDYNNGNTQLGGIFTAVNRDLQAPEVNGLRKSAYTGGMDFIHNWDHKNWYVSGNVIFSQVQGSKEAITDTQTSQEHLFQRPGSGLRVDSAARALTGSGATLKFGKGGHGHIEFQVGGTYKSPNLELNDMGYMYKANALYQFAWASYNKRDPFWFFNRWSVNVNQWTNWDFAGANLYKAANINTNMQFKNFYGMGARVTHTFYKLDNDVLRGGPPLRFPGDTEFGGWIGSDFRKKFNVEFDYDYDFGDQDYEHSKDLSIYISYRPLKVLTFTLIPEYSTSTNSMQYVNNVDFPGGTRYIIGRIDQTTANMTTRINLSLTPNLSIQYYGQPFVSKGTYDQLKYITRADAAEYQNRFHPYTPSELSFDPQANSYSTDEDLDGNVDYTFDNPDFDFVQFRSNMVVRWEYKPGSTLFLVWSQSKTGDDLLQEHALHNLTGHLGDIHPENVFLIKFSYRFIK